MAPIIKEGCRVVVNTRKTPVYHVGDIVAFFQGNIIVGHRIIDILSDGKNPRYLLKGDNKRFDDGYIHHRRIIGRVQQVLYPTYTIDLTSQWNEVLKYAFVVYSRLNRLFPFLRNIRKLGIFSFPRKVYRYLMEQ